MNIGIIGLGLMGGSFALDIKERFKDFVIYGFDKSDEHLKLSFDLKLIDFKLDDDNISNIDLLLISKATLLAFSLLVKFFRFLIKRVLSI